MSACCTPHLTVTPCRRHRCIKTVAVVNLVEFVYGFQITKLGISQHGNSLLQGLNTMIRHGNFSI